MTSTKHLLYYPGMAQQSALKQAIKRAGSQAELARRIGKKQQHIWNWLHRDERIPAEVVLPIEAATGVSRNALRPDLYPEAK